MSAKRGRPKGDPTVPARLSPDQVEKLRKIADARGTTIRAELQRIGGSRIDREYAKYANPQATTPDLGGEA